MRHEKKLLALPVPPCPPLEQRKRERSTYHSWRYFIRYAAEVHSVDGDEVLTVTTFTVDGAPCHRFFQLGEQCGVEVFQREDGYGNERREPGKLYGAGVDRFYSGIGSLWAYDSRTEFYGTEASTRAVLDYLGAPDEAPEKAVELLAKRQQEHRKAVIARREEKQREALRREFEGLAPGAPEGFVQWCEEVPMAGYRYFFYRYTGEPEQEGVCSYCGEASRVAGIRNHKMGTCPRCGSRVKFYSMKQFAAGNGIGHTIQAAVCQPVNGRVAARLFSVGLRLRWDETRGLQKRIWSREHSRSYLDGQTGAERAYYAAPGPCVKVYVDGLCKTGCAGRFGGYPVAPLYLRELREHMGLYTPLEVLAARGCELDAVRMWRAAQKYPKAEYLVKLGLYRLAVAELVGASVLREKGKSVAQLLGVPAEAVQDLRAADPAPESMECIRGLLNCGVRVTGQDMRDISELDLCWNAGNTLLDMTRFGTLHKALKYVKDQLARTKAFRDGGHVLQAWRDYKNMALDLWKDVEDVRVALPKTLKTAHDEAAKSLRARKDRELNKRVARSGDKLKNLCWSFGGLTIRPAVSQEELFQEGETLGHCVGRMGYAEKMAKFRTAIFFIRREKTPDVPYVTLELDLEKWQKIQCYGKHDSWPGKAVDAFVKRWIEEIVKPTQRAKTA